ncbi:hypothetical protein Cyast_0038 [Cyanobacterium stanieri PCC 7202]|uniref:Uncharacterized protein n=1 Tax=Cyanobacterium stanieri (strain ATCC 29140 / PCC 7202) TaxID=292563 RepID=K9YHR3_CYASC|nr:hypothetical protein Cyast_0038 [Cyanobacterium stanieri PCC 7202]
MAKSIKQLRSDLTVLDTEVRLLTRELYGYYQGYIKTFAGVVARQLVLACYQICTQKYPDSFLALSYQKKVDLQDQLKVLSKGFLPKLSSYLAEVDVPKSDIFTDFPQSLTGVVPEVVKSESEGDEDLQTTLEGLSVENELKVNLFPEGLNPDGVLRFYGEVEDCLGEVLTQLSLEANDYLKEYDILPTQVPAKILEMALQNNDSSKGIADSPNLLSLVVEKEDISSKKITKDITPVVAICLRLAEVEFADAGLSADRRRIIAVIDKLIDLQKKYQRTTRLYAIAHAESQWRSCWSDEN